MGLVCNTFVTFSANGRWYFVLRRKKHKADNNDNHKLNISEDESFFETADISDEFDRDDNIDLSEETGEKTVQPVENNEDHINNETHVGGSIEFLKEDNEPETAKFKNAKNVFEHKVNGLILFLTPYFKSFYDYSYLLGIQSYRHGKRILVRIGRFAMKPLRYLFALSRVMVLGIDHLLFRSIHTAHEESSVFRKEMHDLAEYLHLALKEDPISFFPIASHCIKKILVRHKSMFKTAFNLALPVVALLVFWLTVNYWSSVTYALQVTYNNHSIGYIQDESVYVKAQALAVNRLGSGDSGSDAVLPNLDKPVYKLALVKLNQLSDENAICDSLIEAPGNAITNACGIYVDGKFICSVKNETDATGVFNSLLAPYQKSNKNALVAFVENVNVTQGLYKADANMWDAARLAAKLATKKTAAKYYTAKKTDTDSKICNKFGLTEKQFRQMNPGKYIYAGHKYIVSNQVNFVRIKLIRTETKKESIAYKTIKTDNSSLFRGDTRTIRKGVKGKDLVTELVTYIDGNIVGIPKEISRNHLSHPIDAKILVGIKSTSVYNNSGSYNVTVSSEGWVWPVPALHTISSPYGYRWGRFHYADDITGSHASGKIVVAARDGVVESTGWENGGGGNTIIISHGGGLTTKYCHLLSGSISVSPGEHVSAGQAIARVGMTGDATGPHLHFEIAVNGNRVNPLNYI
jgi:murein DD-endopeptidase MepM/ murein hydrolase activator NlpD